MTSVLISLRSTNFEVQSSQFVFIAPVLDYPTITAAQAFVESVWPQPLSLSSLSISVTDASDVSPNFSSRKVLLLQSNCGSYSVDMTTLSSLLRGSEFMIGSDGAVYIDNALIGFQSISLRGSATEISTAIGAISWLPPVINGECDLAMTLSKGMSDGIYSVSINITVGVMSPPRLTIKLTQGILLAEGSTLPLAQLLSQLNDSSPIHSGKYALEVSIDISSDWLSRSFSIVGPGSSSPEALIFQNAGKFKGLNR